MNGVTSAPLPSLPTVSVSSGTMEMSEYVSLILEANFFVRRGFPILVSSIAAGCQGRRGSS